MKKRIPAMLVTLLLMVSVAGAQGLHYGVKADLNLFRISGDGIKDSYSPGGRVGVFATYDFTAKWGIQPELLFSQAGTKKDDNFNARYITAHNPDADKNIKLSYIALPVLLRYNVNKLITINAGPQYALLFYANENLLLKNRTAFKRSDLGLAGGVTINLDNLHFYGRYVYGLSNVNDIDDRYEWKTQQAQIGIGINIR